MAKREIGTSLKLDGEAQFKAAITNINQELRVLSSEMGAAVSSFDKSGASISDLKGKGDIYGRQLDSQKEKLSVLQSAVEKAREAQEKAIQTAAEMSEKYGANSDEAKKASEAVAGITKKLNDYQIQANNTTKNINQLEAAQKANNKEIDKLRSKNLKGILEGIASGAKSAADGIGKVVSATAKITVGAVKTYTASITAAGAAVAGLAKSSIDTGKAFDSSMSQVAATMGTTVDQIEFLAAAAKEMGATTSFTASEAADGLNILAMAGMDMKESVSSTVGYAAVLCVKNLDADAIVAPTAMGKTARLISSFRPNVPIYAVTPNDAVRYKLQLYWGIIPLKGNKRSTTKHIIQDAAHTIMDLGLTKPGQMLVFTAGDPATNATSGEGVSTNMLQIIEV